MDHYQQSQKGRTQVDATCDYDRRYLRIVVGDPKGEGPRAMRLAIAIETGPKRVLKHKYIIFHIQTKAISTGFCDIFHVLIYLQNTKVQALEPLRLTIATNGWIR